MSISSWVVDEVKTALEGAIPELAADDRVKAALDGVVSTLVADAGPLVQNVVNGVVTALGNDAALVAKLADAVTTGVIAAIVGQIENIPQDTTKLLSNELNQLPGQVNALLNIPEAIAAGVAGLPALIVNDLKGILPFPFGEEKKSADGPLPQA
jgi:hypothetical protein